MSYYFLLSDMFMKKKKQNKTAESARQKIENYRVPEYIFLSDV